MFKGNFLYVISYCILFIFQYYSTTARFMKKSDPVDEVQTVIMMPEDYSDKNIIEPDYFYDDLCIDDCGVLEKRNSKRQTGRIGADASPKWDKIFQKYHGFLRDIEENKKSERFVTKSWSAGGMPFNVLYSPNSHQQKILRSVPDKISVSPVHVFPPVGEPMALSAPPPVPYARDEIEARKHQKLWPRSSQRPSNRRRYSIIPQLFVSYGWGPTGK